MNIFFILENQTRSPHHALRGRGFLQAAERLLSMKIIATIFFSFCLTIFALLPLQAQHWEHVSHLTASEITALFTTGNSLFAAGPNKVYFSHDGGLNWDSTTAVNGTVDFIKAVHYEAGRLFVGTVLEGIFSSTDDGQTWQPESNGLTGLGSRNISCLASRGDSLYAGTYGAGVFVKKLSTNSPWSTYNTGMPWFNVESLTNVNGKLFAGAGGNATVAVQVAPGHTWEEIPFAVFDGSQNSFLGVVRQGNVLLAAGTLGLYRSEDDGENWTHYVTGTGVLGTARLVIFGSRAVASLTKPSGLSFLKYTDNQGLDWQNFEPAPAGSITYDLAVFNGRLYAARSNGLWYYAGTTAVVEPAMSAGLVQNFPNPFSGTTTISVEMKKNSWTELSVFNVNGAFIQTLWQGELPPGTSQFQFRAEQLPPGMYLARLLTPEGTAVQRMVLDK
jgi:hypothetical protein